MKQQKYFYVLMRSGKIYEMPYEPLKLKMFTDAMEQKGIAIPKAQGAVINGVDISEVFNEEQYNYHVKAVYMKQYIKDGTWYDGKEHKFLRHEPWKEEMLNNRKKFKPTDNLRSFWDQYSSFIKDKKAEGIGVIDAEELFLQDRGAVKIKDGVVSLLDGGHKYRELKRMIEAANQKYSPRITQEKMDQISKEIRELFPSIRK